MTEDTRGHGFSRDKLPFARAAVLRSRISSAGIATILLICLPSPAAAFTFLPRSYFPGSSYSPNHGFRMKPGLSVKTGNARLSMCSTLPEGLAMIEGIGRSLPSTWFKALGSPSSHLGLQLFFLASNAAYFLAAVKTPSHRILRIFEFSICVKLHVSLITRHRASSFFRYGLFNAARSPKLI
jgi:hypothetical protein